MVNGSWEGKGLKDPEFRKLFEPESIIGSEWYQQRLETRIGVTESYWRGRVEYLEEFLKDHINREASERLGIQERLVFYCRMHFPDWKINQKLFQEFMDVWVLTQAYINKFFTLGYNQIYTLSDCLLVRSRILTSTDGFF